MKSKYGNKRIIIDNIKFASEREGNRYLELKLLQRADKITDLILQPRFELIPNYKIGNSKIRGIKYVADFQYTENGKTVIEDVKGMQTDVYKIKKKLFEFKYGIEIKEI